MTVVPAFRTIALSAGLMAGIVAAGPAHAQQEPAQTVLQQIEQRAEEADRAANPDQQGNPVIADAVPRAELPPPGGPTVLLKEVRFEPPSAFLSEAELDAIAERYLGKRVDFSQIANLVRDVNDVYAERGIITASAILPQQELGEGVLTVQLVEGQMGAVGLLGDRRTKDDFILDRVTLTRGVNVVDVPAAAEDILRFNATHRAQLRMLLQPGASFGLTDIVLGVTEPPPQLLQFTVDNMGVESTGEYQANAIFRQYGALGIDDSLMLSGAVSQGSVAGTISYDLPIGRFGTRLSLAHTQSMINVIGGPSAGLDVTGASQATTATITNPLYIDENWTTQGVVTASYGLSSSAVADVPIVDSETGKIAAGVTIAYSGEWGMISVQPQLLYAGAHERVADELRGMFLFVGSANAYFRLSDEFSVVARGNWQVTEADLLPGDLLFQIGGPSTVRGYPSSGVAGDDGYFGQVEVHWASPTVESLDLFGFVDFGQVFSTFPASQTLVSSGVGVNYSPSERVNLEATVAVPILDTMSGQDVVTVYGRMTSSIQ